MTTLLAGTGDSPPLGPKLPVNWGIGKEMIEQEQNRVTHDFCVVCTNNFHVICNHLMN